MQTTLCFVYVTEGTGEARSRTQRDRRAPSVQVAQDGARTDSVTVRVVTVYTCSFTVFSVQYSAAIIG